MSMSNKIVNALTVSHWNIGFVEEDIHEVLHSQRINIHWMKHNYKDRWFADPQLLEVNEQEIIVLVEEFCYRINKGRIAKLTVRRSDYALMDMKILLELPTHLSFPFIYHKEGKVYIMPENCKADSTKLYRYDSKTDLLEKCSDVSFLPLTDAIIAKMKDGKEFILSTKEPEQNKDVLQIYEFDKERLAIDDQPCQEIRFASNIARNAGEVFEVDGTLYRPSQDCNKCYGNGVVLQKLTYDDGKFDMEDVNAFHSDYPEMDMGYHTFNMKNGLIVVDGHGHNHQWAYQLYLCLSKLKHLFS